MRYVKGLGLVIAAIVATGTPALAAGDECGAIPGGLDPSVICADAALNPYAGGITYTTAGTLTVEVSGVTIDRAPGLSNSGIRVDTSGGLVTINLDSGVSITTTGTNANGVHAQATGAGSVAIDSAATISVTKPDPGAGDTAALYGYILGAASTGNIEIYQHEGSVLTVDGDDTSGVYGHNEGTGGVAVRSAGEIDARGDRGYGLNAWAENDFATGDASAVLDASGKVSVDGTVAVGIYALNYGSGAASVTSFGTVSAAGIRADGLLADQDNATSTADATATLGGDAVVTTSGFYSSGVRAYTMGHGAANIVLGAGTVVQVSGEQSRGLRADGIGGGIASVDTLGQVSATGRHGIGAYAISNGGAATVAVGTGASVTGGWQEDLERSVFDPGPPSELNYRSAGVLLGGGTSSLNNDGAIGALSDRAVFDAGRDKSVAGNMSIVNRGAITGFVELAGGGTNSFDNQAGALFDVRHFADTDGDGAGDTKRVALNDFGDASSSFDNNAGALVRLAPVGAAAAVDPAGFYVPTTGSGGRLLEASFYDLDRAGVVQAQFLNLGTFNNAGVVDLRGAATGNTLVMTSNAAAGGLAGTGAFVSEGGQLLLNTVFNAGIPLGGETNSYSDVLVVDATQVGLGGATGITIDRRTGGGAMTPGNGILVVEVRNKGFSDADAFTLNGDFVAGGEQQIIGGAYRYGLYHNGVDVDDSDGNWYLRNLGIAPTTPVYQEIPHILVPLLDPPTLDQRVGDRYWAKAAPRDLPTVFCKDPSQNFRCTVTAEQEGYYLDQAGTNPQAIWGRIAASQHHGESVGLTPASYDASLAQVQIGTDGLLVENEAGRLFGGVTAHYANTSAEIASPAGAGTVSASGVGLGGTLTWVGTGGLYVDTQAQATFLSTNLVSTTLGTLASGAGGIGYALSVEAGQRMALGDSIVLTPQAQLIYSNLHLDPFTDPFGTVVALDDSHLKGRVGFTVAHESAWQGEAGDARRTSLHAGADFEHVFKEAQISVGGAALASETDPNWGSVRVGGTYQWGDGKYAATGELAAGTGLADFGASREFRQTLGLSVKW